MEKLKDKNIAITGASSGIGRATALRVAKEGANVALIARDRQRLEETAAEIRDMGRKAIVIEADITDADRVKEAVDIAIKELGSLDVFHCNAGIYLRCL